MKKKRPSKAKGKHKEGKEGKKDKEHKEKDREKEKEELKKEEKKPKGKPIPIPEHIWGKIPAYKLKGDFPKVETKMDALLRYIYSRRKVSLGKAPRKFDIDRNTMEEWGGILEESGLIEMHYPVIGQPILRVPIPKPTKKEHKEKEEGEKEKRPKKKVTRKRILINIEIAALLLILIYIFLIDQNLSTNFVPTVQSYIGFLAANPIYPLVMLLIALVPVVLLWLAGRKPQKRVPGKHKEKHKEEKGKHEEHRKKEEHKKKKGKKGK
jgi:hypothetical protein